jgi:putative ABC transport system permease protein
MSALSRQAWGDLRRHPGKCLLIVGSLGLAIASFAIVAVPGLLNGAMQDEVQQARLFDVAVTTRDLDLSPSQLAALGRLPDVAAFEPAVQYSTVATNPSTGIRQNAVLWSVNLGHQAVDAVDVTSGRLPTGTGTTGSETTGSGVLADQGNASAAGFAVLTGDQITITAATGTAERLRVTGTGRSLATSPSANGGNSAVFYAAVPTVRALAGVSGYNYLAFRLKDDSPAAQTATIAAIQRYLTAQTGPSPFTGLPTTRAAGTWPGQSTFNQLITLFLVITVMAVACALFLIASTMNTMVVEQGNEIAILKALGGRRRQIAGVILRTSTALGAAGSVAGTAIGIVLAFLLTRHLAAQLFSVPAGFAISAPVVAASLLAGPVLAMPASLPGLRRAVRRPVADVLDNRTLLDYGTGRLDRILARTQLLSGPTRMGLRNTLRRKRRTVATIAQVTIAVGLAIALFGVGETVASATAALHNALRFQIEADAGNTPFDARAVSIAATTPGVTRVEPLIESNVQLQGEQYSVFGLDPSTLYGYKLTSGRWFTAADTATSAPVVVLGPEVARAVGAHVGQHLSVLTSGGSAQVQVVGIDSTLMNTGTSIFFPLAQLQRLTNSTGTVDALWLTTTTTNHQFVNHVTAAVQTRLGQAGYPATMQESYIETAQNEGTNNSIVTLIEVLGLLVVVIALIGLVGTLTLALIERSREVGILRCLGASARQVRRVFNAEAVLMATAGWALGSLLGYALFLGLLAFVKHDFGITFVQVFPLLSIPVALMVVGLVTLLVIRPTLRRATRIDPAVALRYE